MRNSGGHAEQQAGHAQPQVQAGQQQAEGGAGQVARQAPLVVLAPDAPRGCSRVARAIDPGQQHGVDDEIDAVAAKAGSTLA